MSDAARKGFTPLELLVVIGIIALLVAIRLPALNEARESGHLAPCVTASPNNDPSAPFTP